MKISSFGEGLASPEMEIVEGGAIADNKTRFADLKAMLDSSKDSLKMDAMKRIINLVAKGRDVSELFPAVVKNVAAKNLELKKLVYVYLVRYAEEQQDLALLSISTFQRALKDPNQLIRASALRVLSSIRVQMIAPIMLLAIRDSVRDMSAYVRKVAAHAIPKLYSLDESLQSELIDCIDFLLGDKRTLVLGSAVYAFEETCPDHFHLIHRHYRTLCKTLADVDEWGQITMIGLLTRYARNQFVAPTDNMDPDLGLLLTSCRPLLQSRNCGVVMAVAQLFYHCAPQSQLSLISKATIRLLRGPREVQSIVLLNIATICSANSSLFEPYLKSFFVRPSDPAHIKILKLQIMTQLVSETNVQLLLRELQTYVGMTELADAAVDAIGQCAIRVSSVAESCLMKLVALIASTNEDVVSAAVVVLKKLLHSNAPLSLLTRLFRLIDSIRSPQARACVVWLIATHADKIPKLAPDTLRIMAKTFTHEGEIVKLQTLNLAAKLWLKNRAEFELLVHYVIQLARFDQSYDIRDRCRFIKNMLFTDNKLSEFAPQVFITDKPSPTVRNTFKDREQFQLGSLSHYLNQRCSRYRDLPQFPENAPDPSVRGVIESNILNTDGTKIAHEDTSEAEDEFYSGDEDEESEFESDEEDEMDENEEDENEESIEEDDNDDEAEDENEEEKEEYDKLANYEYYFIKSHKEKQSKKIEAQATKPTNVDLLLDLNFDSIPAYCSLGATESDFKQLLSHAAWPIGVLVEASFDREICTFDPAMCAVILKFTNESTVTSPAFTVKPVSPEDIAKSNTLYIDEIPSKSERLGKVYIDFGDSGRTSIWKLEVSDVQNIIINIEAPVGEQLIPITLSEEEFRKSASRLSGMSEHKKPIKASLSRLELLKIANCASVPGSEVNYCAQTRSKKQLVLISLTEESICVRSDNAVIGSLLCNLISRS